jgi:hypothetical protein
MACYGALRGKHRVGAKSTATVITSTLKVIVAVNSFELPLVMLNLKRSKF